MVLGAVLVVFLVSNNCESVCLLVTRLGAALGAKKSEGFLRRSPMKDLPWFLSNRTRVKQFNAFGYSIFHLGVRDRRGLVKALPRPVQSDSDGLWNDRSSR